MNMDGTSRPYSTHSPMMPVRGVGPATNRQHGQLPAFLTKTYDLLEDAECRPYIEWHGNATGGCSFIIKKPSEFARDVLPRFFKHNKLSSFVRQLNIYGFHKCGDQSYEFQHPNFVQGRRDLLWGIKRKDTTDTVRKAKLQEEKSISERLRKELLDSRRHLRDAMEAKKMMHAQLVDASMRIKRLNNMIESVVSGYMNMKSQLIEHGIDIDGEKGEKGGVGAVAAVTSSQNTATLTGNIADSAEVMSEHSQRSDGSAGGRRRKEVLVSSQVSLNAEELAKKRQKMTDEGEGVSGADLDSDGSSQPYLQSKQGSSSAQTHSQQQQKLNSSVLVSSPSVTEITGDIDSVSLNVSNVRSKSQDTASRVPRRAALQARKELKRVAMQSSSDPDLAADPEQLSVMNSSIRMGMGMGSRSSDGSRSSLTSQSLGSLRSALSLSNVSLPSVVSDEQVALREIINRVAQKNSIDAGLGMDILQWMHNTETSQQAPIQPLMASASVDSDVMKGRGSGSRTISHSGSTHSHSHSVSSLNARAMPGMLGSAVELSTHGFDNSRGIGAPMTMNMNTMPVAVAVPSQQQQQQTHSQSVGVGVDMYTHAHTHSQGSLPLTSSTMPMSYVPPAPMMFYTVHNPPNPPPTQPPRSGGGQNVSAQSQGQSRLAQALPVMHSPQWNEPVPHDWSRTQELIRQQLAFTNEDQHGIVPQPVPQPVPVALATKAGYNGSGASVNGGLMSMSSVLYSSDANMSLQGSQPRLDDSASASSFKAMLGEMDSEPFPRRTMGHTQQLQMQPQVTSTGSFTMGAVGTGGGGGTPNQNGMGSLLGAAESLASIAETPSK